MERCCSAAVRSRLLGVIGSYVLESKFGFFCNVMKLELLFHFQERLGVKVRLAYKPCFMYKQ
jgi:hypothetical protein